MCGGTELGGGWLHGSGAPFETQRHSEAADVTRPVAITQRMPQMRRDGTGPFDAGVRGGGGGEEGGNYGL